MTGKHLASGFFCVLGSVINPEAEALNLAEVSPSPPTRMAETALYTRTSSLRAADIRRPMTEEVSNAIPAGDIR